MKGEVVLKHNLGKKSSLKGLKALFAEDKNKSLIPWFIESTKIKSENEIYIKLDSLNTREQAQVMVQKEAWLPEEDIKSFAAKSAPVNLLGFRIVNEGEELGEILEIIEQPHQLLCRIEIRSKEVLIPLNENTIRKIDQRKKEVIVELPEGLLDIYLQ